MALVVCPRCHRHVRRGECECPFCWAPIRISAGLPRAAITAVVLSTGVAVASCDSNAVAIYAGVVPPFEDGSISSGGQAAGADGGDGSVMDQISQGSDAEQDDASQPCGSTTCQAGQACVLHTGGPAPRCLPAEDGGCPTGLVYASFCSSGGTQRSPGCTDPAPSPGCVDLPDGCDNVCGCVCPGDGGTTCSVVPGQYVRCALP
jgi:hypothetical protein